VAVKLIPLAFDSLGVRSMATYVETQDVKALIDPGAALGPRRYGLPPAKEEYEELERSLSRIKEYAEKSDILTISHYHYDHHDPDTDFYGGKIVYAKDRLHNINRSQRERGRYFEERVRDSCTLIYADGKEFEHGNTTLRFSEPFPHGNERTRLGYVIMVSIERKGEKVMHASDVSGPIYEKAADYIISENPDTVIMDGPATIFLGWKMSYRDLERAEENLLRIIRETDAEIILDHHLLRDLKYRERLKRVYEHGNVKTAAEYLGMENNMLEARRKELWAKRTREKEK
jgi:predicted metallo-beta-lactamase superfamily hydrolase